MYEEKTSEGTVGVTEAPKLFIKIKAAFTPDEMPDYRAMGIDVEETQIEPEFLPVYLNITKVVSLNENKHGGMNITTSDGDRWSTNDEITNKIKELFDQLSIDLT